MSAPDEHAVGDEPTGTLLPLGSARRVQERGKAWCDWCLNDFPANGVDVDHVRPLALGGEDIDSNVQVLCHLCHQLQDRHRVRRCP